MSHDDLREYRVKLIDAEQKSQAEFDRTVLTLSGGALGISFAFVNQFVGDGEILQFGSLLTAWTLWALSVATVLVSHYLSTQAMRRAISQVDDGTIRQSRPGGAYDVLLMILNAGGGIFFIVGLAFVAHFVFGNLN